MPKVTLTPSFVENPPACPGGRYKVDYFDTQLPGFMLEVRSTGKCTYYQRYRDKFGRIKQSRIGPTDAVSLEDARSRARQIRSQTVMGFDPRAEVERSRSMPTFGQFVREQYLPFVKVHKRSWDQDKKMINNRLMPVWGRLRISEIQREHVQAFQSDFLQGGSKPASVNRYMALVKYIFNLAERWEVIDKNPARHVAQLSADNNRERYLSEEETERLLEALNSCVSRVVPDIIELLIVTGARKSEVVNLPWSEVDMERGVWTIPSDRNKSKVRKVIPLSQSALRVLRKRECNGSPYVFPNPKTGKPLRHFHGTWDRIRTKAGIPDVRIHDLRHNFASLLINSGRSLYEVQKLLGHSQLSTTQRYAHLTQDTLKDATEMVSERINGESGTSNK